MYKISYQGGGNDNVSSKEDKTPHVPSDFTKTQYGHWYEVSILAG